LEMNETCLKLKNTARHSVDSYEDVNLACSVGLLTVKLRPFFWFVSRFCRKVYDLCVGIHKLLPVVSGSVNKVKRSAFWRRLAEKTFAWRVTRGFERQISARSGNSKKKLRAHRESPPSPSLTQIDRSNTRTNQRVAKTVALYLGGMRGERGVCRPEWGNLVHVLLSDASGW